MEAIANGFEKLLWFIYRVFFVLVPSLVFIALSFWILKYNGADTSNSLFFGFLETSSNKVWLIIVFAFFLNVIFESVAGEFLSFRDQAKHELYQKPIYSTLLANINSDLKQKETKSEKVLEVTDFAIAKMLMIQKFSQVSNFFWFFHVNHKIFLSSTVCISLLSLLFLPFTIYTKFNLWSTYGNGYFLLFQAIQFVLTCLSILYIKQFIRSDKQLKVKVKIVVVSILIGLVIAFVAAVLPLVFHLILLIISFNFLIFPLLFITALSSYRQNRFTYQILADFLIMLKYGEAVIGKDMFPASEPPKPPVEKK